VEVINNSSVYQRFVRVYRVHNVLWMLCVMFVGKRNDDNVLADWERSKI